MNIVNGIHYQKKATGELILEIFFPLKILWCALSSQLTLRISELPSILQAIILVSLLTTEFSSDAKKKKN